MRLDEITPVLLTFNEAPNIERTLGCLIWANSIVVVDSGSTDETRELVASVPSVRWEERRFDNHAAQWNYAVGLAKTEWVLVLDADYQVTEAFKNELQSLNTEGFAAFRSGFLYSIASKPLRCGIYPPVIVLCRRSLARFIQDGHTQRMNVVGKVGTMITPLVHDDRKTFRRWFRSQVSYASLEAPKIAKLKWRNASIPERLRKSLIIMPILLPLYILFIRGGVFDGWRGFRYASERTLAELMVSTQLVYCYICGQAARGKR